MVSLYKIVLTLYSQSVLPIMSRYDFQKLTKSSGLIAEVHTQVLDELSFLSIQNID